MTFIEASPEPHPYRHRHTSQGIINFKTMYRVSCKNALSVPVLKGVTLYWLGGETLYWGLEDFFFQYKVTPLTTVQKGHPSRVYCIQRDVCYKQSNLKRTGPVGHLIETFIWPMYFCSMLCWGDQLHFLKTCHQWISY